MLSSILAALRDLPARELRGVLLKSLGITVGLLLVVGVGLDALVSALVTVPYPWLSTALGLLTGLGLLAGAVFLIVPVTALVAGLFVDEVAASVERRWYPEEPAGRPLPFAVGIAEAVRFALLAGAVNLGVLLLLLVPGINIAAFFLANGYLLGREYFELAAGRFRPPAEAKALRRRHAGRVFLAGLAVALFVAIPFVNLLTPLFATALLVHVHKDVEAIEAGRAAVTA